MPQCTLLPQINQFNSMNNFSQNILIAFILKELIRSFFILTNFVKTFATCNGKFLIDSSLRFLSLYYVPGFY